MDEYLDKIGFGADGATQAEGGHTAPSAMNALAALDLNYGADHSRMHLLPAAQRAACAHAAAGSMAQNVDLYCASAGLASVVRAWFDRHALSQAMGLSVDQQLLLSQTVGVPEARK